MFICYKKRYVTFLKLFKHCKIHGLKKHTLHFKNVHTFQKTEYDIFKNVHTMYEHVFIARKCFVQCKNI